MRNTTLALLLAGLTSLFPACGGNSVTSPSSPPTSTPATTTAPATSSFEISTVLTVYRHNDSGAFWTRATTTTERIGEIILGVDDLNTATGSTNLNNEGGREELQDAIDRIRGQFETADYLTAFDETQANLERFFNDADNDGWSIDGRNGAGKDWPHDRDGNDPDGWTGQLVVTVTKQ